MPINVNNINDAQVKLQIANSLVSIANSMMRIEQRLAQLTTTIGRIEAKIKG